MRASLVSLVMLTTIIAGACGQGAVTIYVAPFGNDGWSGRLDRPNAAATDGPFATLVQAQLAVREVKQVAPDQAVSVLVRGGVYELDEPLRFSSADSGTETAPVVWAAYAGESPVISGGRRLTGWSVTPEGRWELKLPEVAAGAWTFTQLFVNGERRYRPRWPEEGYSFITGAMPPPSESGARGFDRFSFDEGDISAGWANLEDVELLTFHTWTMDRTHIAALDEEKRIVRRSRPTPGPYWFFAMPRGGRFICENVKEALNEPGEWYLDRPTGTLTYIPCPGEDPAMAEVVAPRLETPVRIEGDSGLGLYVEQIIFRGLIFAHGAWEMREGGNAQWQGEVALPGAVRATDARVLRWEDCAIRHVGTYGLELGEGCRECVVEGCVITDMGAGGVKIGTQAYTADEASVAGHNVVRDCLIAHGGRMHPAGIGVWIGHSPYNTIAHNEICDFYYSGLSVGWTWGYGDSNAHHNIIEYNEVHDIGQGVLSDMGGIYTLGVSPGTVIRNNRFHDVDAFGYGGWGIYLDQGSAGILSENNITYRTRSPGYRILYGRDNVACNNILALSEEGPLGRGAVDEYRSFTIEHNICYWTEGMALQGNWSGTQDSFILDHNLYWSPDPALLKFAGKSFEQWQATGHDTHSIVADPMFVDPEHGDFSLKPNSPAERTGFRPIDVSTVGRTGAPGAQTPLAMPRAFPPRQSPPPLPIAADFENLKTGAKPSDATVTEEGEPAVIRVADETAAEGEHSLKFVDAPGQKAGYNPHMFYQPNFAEGVAVASFDLRVEPGTYLYHEWRDLSTATYKVGPSLTIAADGSFIANGKKLFDVRYSQWMQVEIRCGLGDRATGTYDLTVRLPGEDQPRVYEDVPCPGAFGVLSWFGFVANANAAGVFYLDDLRLEYEARTH